jgi:hypothetical protein
MRQQRAVRARGSVKAASRRGIRTQVNKGWTRCHRKATLQATRLCDTVASTEEHGKMPVKIKRGNGGRFSSQWKYSR